MSCVGSSKNFLVGDLDVDVHLERKPGMIHMSCKIPTLNLLLSYLDYRLCNRILRNNVWKALDDNTMFV